MFFEYLYEVITGKPLPEENVGIVDSYDKNEDVLPEYDDGLFPCFVGAISGLFSYVKNIIEKPRDPLRGEQIQALRKLENKVAELSIEPDKQSRMSKEEPKAIYLNYKGYDFATAYGSRLDIRDRRVLEEHPELAGIIDLIRHSVYDMQGSVSGPK